jgi:hypothetical protein
MSALMPGWCGAVFGKLLAYARISILVLLATVVLLSLLIGRGNPLAVVAVPWEVHQELYPLGANGAAVCLTTSTYAYDPRRVTPDTTLLQDRPETTLAAHLSTLVTAPDSQLVSFTIERVEVEMNDLPALANVWTRLRYRDGHEEFRPFRLRANHGQRVTLDPPEVELMLCNKALGDWETTW